MQRYMYLMVIFLNIPVFVFPVCCKPIEDQHVINPTDISHIEVNNTYVSFENPAISGVSKIIIGYLCTAVPNLCHRGYLHLVTPTSQKPKKKKELIQPFCGSVNQIIPELIKNCLPNYFKSPKRRHVHPGYPKGKTFVGQKVFPFLKVCFILWGLSDFCVAAYNLA